MTTEKVEPGYYEDVDPDREDDPGTGIDFYIDSWCNECDTFVTAERLGIEEGFEWSKSTCECGALEVAYRAAPWPRDGMVYDEDEEIWHWPEDEIDEISGTWETSGVGPDDPLALFKSDDTDDTD